MIQNKLIVEEPQKLALRRTQREKRLAISNYYVAYLLNLESD